MRYLLFDRSNQIPSPEQWKGGIGMTFRMRQTLAKIGSPGGIVKVSCSRIDQPPGMMESCRFKMHPGRSRAIVTIVRHRNAAVGQNLRNFVAREIRRHAAANLPDRVDEQFVAPFAWPMLPTRPSSGSAAAESRTAALGRR
ncbi:hypothetical protein [Marimonas arenosa]|uniref:Uncharacterized protein n=1 Tax=Marimonas arenosa TaxID=1795305 RepID=A0AAE4B334_9RHOB|nr:hypothetical protein [Marimonas arenosa]MDQ2089628.1 hypothetical protein [Marimonas arenosa]